MLARFLRRCPGILGGLLSLAMAGPAQPLSPPAATDAEDPLRQSLHRITSAFHAISEHFAEPVEPERAIYHGVIPGLMARLDPFSVFLDPEQYQLMQQQSRGVRQGFGAVLNVQAGRITVLQSVPDSPFGRAGLGPGDRIVAINGQRVAMMNLEELVQALNEARKGKVRLAVLQGGSVVPRDVEMDPAEVPSPTVDRQFLWGPGVGYLRISRIEPGTPEEIRKALAVWSREPLEGVILDLRNNPGGSVDAAVETAGLFLPQGAAVARLQGRGVPEVKYAVEAAPLYPKLPLVLLLNERSASAAEMIAAAFQEHDRAWLVGEPTFGKGVAESVLPLSGGNALILTTARYFTPQGRSLQKPLPGTALAGILERGPEEFFTNHGRPVQEQGGVVPDERAEPWRLEEWAEILDQTTVFINFAQRYVDSHRPITEQFYVDDPLLESFRRYLREAGFEVSDQQWRQNALFLRTKLRAEVFNLVFGISKGDEALLREDPQVLAAVAALPQARALLEQFAPGTNR